MKIPKDAIAPEGPLQLLQGMLEMELQLVNHTLHVYKYHLVYIPDGRSFRMSEFGYEARLCNMALVSAEASLEGFYGNILRIIRSNGNPYTKRQLTKEIKKTPQFTYIIEPLARRNCIVHNFAKVDKEYLNKVRSTKLNINDPLSIDLHYLKKASTAFFETAIAIIKALIVKGLLPDKSDTTIGTFNGKIGS